MASIVQKIQEWVNTCPCMSAFTTGTHIDWTDCKPGNYGIAPAGCSNVDEMFDVLGGLVVYKQYNLVLYARNWTMDDVIRLENTNFLDDFQQWVEEQQATGLTPKFGDAPDDEAISAENGMIFELSENGQTGLYQIQLQITYEKHYEGK